MVHEPVFESKKILDQVAMSTDVISHTLGIPFPFPKNDGFGMPYLSAFYRIEIVPNWGRLAHFSLNPALWNKVAEAEATQFLKNHGVTFNEIGPYFFYDVITSPFLPCPMVVNHCTNAIGFIGLGIHDRSEMNLSMLRFNGAELKHPHPNKLSEVLWGAPILHVSCTGLTLRTLPSNVWGRGNSDIEFRTPNLYLPPFWEIAHLLSAIYARWGDGEDSFPILQFPARSAWLHGRWKQLRDQESRNKRRDTERLHYGFLVEKMSEGGDTELKDSIEEFRSYEIGTVQSHLSTEYNDWVKKTDIRVSRHLGEHRHCFYNNYGSIMIWERFIRPSEDRNVHFST